MHAHLILRATLVAAVMFTTVMPVTKAVAQATQEDPLAKPSQDDLRALRYYIETNEQAAIAAEIRRLRIDFPSWNPPDNLAELLNISPSTEIDEIYARIAAGNLTGARQLLVDTQGEYPNWTPPADMTALLEVSEAQVAFDSAVAARNLEAAVNVAIGNPELLRCNRINNTWQLAELQAASRNTAAAIAAYQQIVQTCSTVADVVATIEKANPIASVTELQGLILTAESRLPNSVSTFDALEARLLAGRGIAPPPADGAAPATGTVVTAPTTGTETAPVTTTTTTAPATTTAPVQQPVTAAAPQQAAAPVSAGAPLRTIASAPSPLSGLPRSGDGRLSRVRAAAQAENFRDCVAESTNPRSLDVAYERAWCVYNLERPLEALALFTAAANGGLGGSVPRDARYGMALSFLELQMTDAASEIAASTDLTMEQRRTIEGIILDQRGVRAYNEGDYRQAIIYFDGLEQLEGQLRRDLALLRGYAWLNLGERGKAMVEFQRLNSELATPDTRAAIEAARR